MPEQPSPRPETPAPAGRMGPAAHSVPFDPPEDDRRSFLKKALAVATGAVATLAPVAAGVVFLLDPVRRGAFVPLKRRGGNSAGDEEGYVRVTTLDALPGDGKPQKFTVIQDQADAWSYLPDQRIGNVFLRKIGEEVIAFNEICPHLGCSVAYDPSAPEDKAFRCPCHASAFSLSGEKSNAIPPRDLDELEVDIRNGNEVWVRYQKFITGTSDKTAIT